VNSRRPSRDLTRRYLLIVACVLLTYVSSRLSRGSIDNIASRDVWIDANGAAIHGRLYSPDEAPSTERIAAVLIAHGYLGNYVVMEQSFALELSARGYTVLSLDFSGHGRSGGGIRSFESPLIPSDSHVPIEAGIAYLRRTIGDPMLPVGLIGHSEGAKAVREAASHDDRIAATVYISGPTNSVLYSPPQHFGNLLLLYGRDDRITPAPTRQDAGDAPWVREPGTLAGDMALGTARRLSIVPGRGHFGILFDSGARRLAIEWLDESFRRADRTRSGDVDPLRLAWMGLGYVALIVGTSVVSTVIAPAATAGGQPAPGLRIRTAGIRLGICLVAAGLAGEIVGALAPLFNWLPVSGGKWICASLYALGVGTGVVLVVLHYRPRADEPSAGLGRRCVRYATTGMACWLFFTSCLIVLAYDYYGFLLSGRRIALFFAMLPLFLPAVVAWQIVVSGIAESMGEGGWARVGLATATVLILGVFLWRAVTHVQGIRVVFPFGVCLGLLSSAIFVNGRQILRGTVVASVFQTLLLAWGTATFCPFY
jgi:dienelactone hydrolase